MDSPLLEVAYRERLGTCKKDSNALQLPWRVSRSMFLSSYPMSLGKQHLWGTGIHKLIGQTAAETACLGQDFLSDMVIKRKHQFLMFKRTQVGYIVLVENEDYRSGWPEHIHDSGAGLGI